MNTSMIQCTDREGGIKRPVQFRYPEELIRAILIEQITWRCERRDPIEIPPYADMPDGTYPNDFIFIGDLTGDMNLAQSVFFSDGAVLDAHFFGFRPTQEPK